MRILENGIYRDATEEEIKQCGEKIDQPVTDAERIETLEATVQSLTTELAAAKVLLGVE